MEGSVESDLSFFKNSLTHTLTVCKNLKFEFFRGHDTHLNFRLGTCQTLDDAVILLFGKRDFFYHFR